MQRRWEALYVCHHCSHRSSVKFPEHNRAQEVWLWIKFSFQVTLYNQFSKRQLVLKGRNFRFSDYVVLKTSRKLSHPSLTLILDCWSEITEKREQLWNCQALDFVLGPLFSSTIDLLCVLSLDASLHHTILASHNSLVYLFLISFIVKICRWKWLSNIFLSFVLIEKTIFSKRL